MEAGGRITEAEREAVRRLVESLYERWASAQPEGEKTSYAEFARQSNVSYNSLAVWRAPPTAKKRSTPEAYELMKLLRVAGVLGERFELPAAKPVGATVAAALAEAEAAAERLAPGGQQRHGRARRASG